MQQPSANGIADLYRGNPAPLQQRIQQEQQAKPGLAPDLQKLLALNIVTNEGDAMAREKAMSQLAQMQGQQGKPPTVMETVQEQARKKMQAQQVQARQQQQAMQAMAQQAGPGPVPPGTPQPEAQPQGIDELPVEFEMAGGGIVAFQSRGSVPSPTEKDLEEQRKSDSEILRAIGNTLGKGAKDVATKLVAAGADIASLIPRGLAGAVDTAVIRPARALGADIGYISPELTPGNQSPDTMTPFYDRYILGREEAAEKPKTSTASSPAEESGYSKEGRTGARPYPSAPVKDIKALAEQESRKKTPRPAPAAPAAPAPVLEQKPAATPSGGITTPMSSLGSEAQNLQAERMRADPQAGAANREMMYQSRIGAPDTTQRDAMIKQLQEERARHAEPEGGFAGLMEYLGQIAATPRGLSSFEAGAAGARGVKALEEQRAQKRFDLGSKIIEQEQGKIDASRAYAKEVYGIGEKEYDRVYKEKLEAALQITKDETEARKMAQQEMLKFMELNQQDRHKTAELAQQRELRLKEIAAQGANRAFNPVEQLYNLQKTGDKVKDAATLERLVRENAEARKPGLDIETVKKFESLPGVKTDLQMLSALRTQTSPKPETVERIRQLESRLTSKARENGIDPAKLGLSGGNVVSPGVNSDLFNKADAILSGGK